MEPARAELESRSIQRTHLRSSLALLVAAVLTPVLGCSLVSVLERAGWVPGALAPVLGVLLVLAMPALTLAAIVQRFPRQAGSGSLRADEQGGLHVHTESARWHWERGELDWASLSSTPSGVWQLVVALRSGELVQALLEEDAPGRRLLRALGLEGRQRRAVFRLQRLLTRMLNSMFTVPSLLLAGGFLGAQLQVLLRFTVLPPALGLLAGFVLGALAARYVWRNGPGVDVVVGTDGVRVRELFRTWFVPWARVASLREETERLALVLEDGTERYLWLGHDMGPTSSSVVGRLREAFEAARANQNRAVGEALLRGGRSVAQWLEGLKKVAEARAADYRSTPLSDEQLWRLLEDGSLPPEVRTGAALVLRFRGGEGARVRLRVNADAAASEAVRVALEGAAEGELDESALERAERAHGAQRG